MDHVKGKMKRQRKNEETRELLKKRENFWILKLTTLYLDGLLSRFAPPQFISVQRHFFSRLEAPTNSKNFIHDFQHDT